MLVGYGAILETEFSQKKGKFGWNAEICFYHFTCLKIVDHLRPFHSDLSRLCGCLPAAWVATYFLSIKKHILNILNETSQSNHVPTKELPPNRCNKCVFVLTCFSHITSKLPLYHACRKIKTPPFPTAPNRFHRCRGMESSSYSRWGAYGCVVKGSLWFSGSQNLYRFVGWRSCSIF